MQVIATKAGYFGKLRQAGDTFDVPDGSKASWFAPSASVAESNGKKAKGELKAKEETQGASDLV